MSACVSGARCQIGWRIPVAHALEGQKLLMPVTPLAGGEHCAVEDSQGGEARRGAVATPLPTPLR